MRRKIRFIQGTLSTGSTAKICQLSSVEKVNFLERVSSLAWVTVLGEGPGRGCAV